MKRRVCDEVDGEIGRDQASASEVQGAAQAEKRGACEAPTPRCAVRTLGTPAGAVGQHVVHQDRDRQDERRQDPDGALRDARRDPRGEKRDADRLRRPDGNESRGKDPLGMEDAVLLDVERIVERDASGVEAAEPSAATQRSREAIGTAASAPPAITSATAVGTLGARTRRSQD